MLFPARKLKDAVECPPTEIPLCNNALRTPQAKSAEKGSEAMAVQGGSAEWRTRR
jgi:hypothetical protein